MGKQFQAKYDVKDPGHGIWEFIQWPSANQNTTNCRINCNIVWGQCNKTLLEKLQILQNKAARTIASLRYEDANHWQIILQYGWLSVEHLIYYDLGVFMYKTINGLSPAISSFQNVKYIHQYQTRLATNGNLYIYKC